MLGKRPRTPSSSPSDGPSKRQRSDSLDSWDGFSNQRLRVYVVQAKLDEKEIADIYRLVESHASGLHLQLSSSPETADIIITVVHMLKRLERHVPWDVAKQKSIVTPEWLRQSIKLKRPAPCGGFAAIRQLHNDTVEHCPEQDESSEPSQNTAHPMASAESVVVFKPTSEKVKNNWRSRYACARAHPLICPNQALAIALNVLGRSRELEGLSVNALAYERAVAIIKSYPSVITRDNFRQEISKLPGVGSKVRSKIEEFINNGTIEETETTLESERYRSLSLFNTVYGIGPSAARHLYELGLRSVGDLERYYDVPQGANASQLDDIESQTFTPNGRPVPLKSFTEGNAKIPPISVKVALALREDLNTPIPRAELEEIHRVIMSELEQVQAGCTSTVVGGHRRGKLESNDMDIVITHSDMHQGTGSIKGMAAKLVERLYKRGLVTHVMHLSGFHSHNPLRTEHWDSLEKALTVFRLPASSTASQSQSSEAGSQTRRLYRRLDLIFAPPEAYWTAVVGWSGSRLFERDLRLWAKVEKGMKFDSSGLTRRHDSKLFVPENEEDVFKILGLEWVDPTLRNANV
ncbi:hypothetical protein AGABI2DRAFT_118163 [Agaricus bisporus var. bisporus H97]|uniref:hypothetical protein n=1 Tax=Agaricus bisporus var. bisporus (strain H97 / ATCC MYA-4626 / FGSC 10389) TaxID=936046 RepID=UPI00029F7CEC|nr:hypothetical protein AGABI2DRAFT_118163 [Agaricus bisporus var. bisporus H97]EKV47607.1 hypothetical protein AGABI2DRAFT_118163 [Agaricus bisporus var. bisporus H97]